MTARAEQIISAIAAEVTGLATTGPNVTRARVYPYQDSQLPGICVCMGTNRVIQELENSFIDWQLTVYIDIYTKSASFNVDTLLNQVMKEIYEAVMVDETHGLAFVYDTTPDDVREPQFSGEGNQPVAWIRVPFLVSYRSERKEID